MCAVFPTTPSLTRGLEQLPSDVGRHLFGSFGHCVDTDPTCLKRMSAAQGRMGEKGERQEEQEALPEERHKPSKADSSSSSSSSSSSWFRGMAGATTGDLTAHFSRVSRSSTNSENATQKQSVYSVVAASKRSTHPQAGIQSAKGEAFEDKNRLYASLQQQLIEARSEHEAAESKEHALRLQIKSLRDEIHHRDGWKSKVQLARKGNRTKKAV